MPPFFHLGGERVATGGLACRIERTDGSTTEGSLTVFHPESGHIGFRQDGAENPVEVPLTQVRIAWLRDPQDLQRDDEAAHGIGSHATAIPNDLPFTVHLKDGSRLVGRTRGFVRKKCGLYLFTVERDQAAATACFIPAQQLRSLDIGALLGRTLAERKDISEPTLTTALNRQAALRRKKIGHYIADRGILTAAELAGALDRHQRKPTVKLGELLVAEKLITNEQLEEALATQKSDRSRRLGDILVEMGAVTVRTIQIALSDKLGVPFVNVRSFAIDPVTLGLLPPSVAFHHQVLPLLQLEDRLVVAVENPLSGDYVSELQFVTQLTIVPVIADPIDLQARIALEYVSNAPSAPAERYPLPVAAPVAGVSELAEQLAREAPDARDIRLQDVAGGHSDNTLVRLVNKIIVDANAQGASDIHIESNAGKMHTRIRFRKDGDLVNYLELSPAFRSAIVSRIKVMAGLDISEHRHAQDGKIDFSRFWPLQLELRVAVVPTANNLEDVVMRLLGAAEALPIEKLGLVPQDLADLKQMVDRSYGLVLVCGPTGSGKTTTLHSVLHHINRPDLKIWTAEDPVEITQPGLRQVQINARIGWTFANAMRSFLRADPDVIMVGEMRDAETAKIGIEASLTGHLVFSTLHTNSAAESVTRLLELGMDPFNFADALIGIISQRLARKLCAYCKHPHVLSDQELHDLAVEYCTGTTEEPAGLEQEWRRTFGHEGPVTIFEPAGCDQCCDGWKGRLGVYELLRADAELKQRIQSHGTVPQILQAARAAGMKTLKQDALIKVLQGSLDLHSARRVAT